MKLEIINCGYWNERIKKIIIICLSCVIIMNASINVFANYIEKQVYSFNYDDIKIYVDSLLSLINVPYVKISGIAGKLVNTANKVDAEYIEVTDNKYFIHNYSANTSMNCHHMYFVFYDTIGGNRSVVATEWNFYQQVL